MTPDSLFAVSGPIALAGWLALVAGIVLDRPFLRDRVAGLLIPLLLSAAYTVLILIFWWSAEGGFGIARRSPDALHPGLGGARRVGSLSRL